MPQLLMTIQDLQKKVIAFRDERNWKQFHNPKDSAIALNLEATEVMVHFLWKSEKEMKEYVEKNKEAIGEELADTLYWVLLMSNDLNIDIEEAFTKKLVINEKKYPVRKSRGKHNKYTEL